MSWRQKLYWEIFVRGLKNIASHLNIDQRHKDSDQSKRTVDSLMWLKSRGKKKMRKARH